MILNKNRYQRGFTLVELSIVIIIVSLLMASGLAVGTSMVQQAHYIDTQKKLAQIRQSLHDFYIVNGHLPCAARLDILPSHADFGSAVDCSANISGTQRVGSPIVRIGMVPSRTLGLTDRAASDAYGNRIIYAVTEILTVKEDFGGGSGGIVVADGSNLTTPNTISSEAAYILVSTGADRKGATSYATAGEQDCDAGFLDTQNCDLADEIFRDAAYNSGDINNRFFDDIVAWAPKFHFMALDTESNALWSSNGEDIFATGTDGEFDTGYVGIGTTNPYSPLHVSGTFDFASKGKLQGYPPEANNHRNMAMVVENTSPTDGGGIVLIITDDNNDEKAIDVWNTALASRVFTVSANGRIVSPATYDLTTGSAANVYVHSNGVVYRSTSSRKYKKDIEDYTDGLGKLDLLRPVTFHSTTNDDGQLHAGFIAEEVDEAGLQEFVTYDQEGKPDGLNYGHMTALLAKALQEMKAENADLKQRITELEAMPATPAKATSPVDNRLIGLTLLALLLAAGSLLLHWRKRA